MQFITICLCVCMCVSVYQSGGDGGGGVLVIKEAVLQPESIWCNCIRGGVFLSWQGVPILAAEESQM